MDPAAELAVLGAVLADRRKFVEVADLIRTPDVFGVAAHALIWAALLELDADDRPFDPVSLAAALKARGDLDGVGGVGYLATLDTAAPFRANAIEYARIVAAAAGRRRLHALAQRLADGASSGEQSAEALATEAQQGLVDAVGMAPTGGLEPVPRVLERTLDLLDRMRASVGGVTGLPSGHIELDRMLTGFHPGELIVLAARPGVGKTALAMNWAAHAAERVRKPVAVFSLEMPSEQLAMRLLAAEGRVALSRLRQGGLSEMDMANLNSVAARLYQAPLHIDATAALGLFGMRTRCRQLVSRIGGALGLVVVDYLQLMGSAGDGRRESREQEVAACSRGLKQLAKDLGCPVIALSQLNRKVEERKGGRPILSDLRESGSVEQDADAVLFLYEPETEDADAGPGAKQMELIVAKQRNGPTGSVFLHLLPEFVKFEQRAREWQQ